MTLKKQQVKLISSSPISALLNQLGISSWDDLTEIVKHLPYGRNSNRHDLQLVITEKKGTCSSKHALLKQLADENKIPNVELVLGMYKMNATNTPKIGKELEKQGLEYIPEAHCYLLIENQRKDFTSPTSNFARIAHYILEETFITPAQVAEYKVQYHQTYLKQWIKKTGSRFTFDEIWKIREQCIRNLES